MVVASWCGIVQVPFRHFKDEFMVMNSRICHIIGCQIDRQSWPALIASSARSA